MSLMPCLSITRLFYDLVGNIHKHSTHAVYCFDNIQHERLAYAFPRN